MEKKANKAPAPKGNTIPELPLTPEQARHVKGGASDIFAKIGDIKGESIDDPKDHKLNFRRR